MSTKGKSWTSATDSPEDIMRCLSCTRSRCVDCIGRKIPDSQETFNRKTDGYKGRMLNATAREVIRLYRTAKNDKDIAEQMGRPLSTITAVRRRFGLPAIRDISEENRNKLADVWLERG